MYHTYMLILDMAFIASSLFYLFNTFLSVIVQITLLIPSQEDRIHAKIRGNLYSNFLVSFLHLEGVWCHVSIFSESSHDGSSTLDTFLRSVGPL